MIPQTTIYKANDRGFADHGWLKTKYSFSFSNYYNPDRINFGALRVINDDIIAGGRGFGMHPHDNMEIITIPLEGDLAHKDSMGNAEVIRSGDIQIMSAGTGITHSEFNANADKEVKLFQIWVFPNKRNVQPSYQQITLNKEKRHNHLEKIISPDNDGEGVFINQDAWFHLGSLDKELQLNYEFKKPGNGLYALVVKGDVLINDNLLNSRDAIGITGVNQISIKAQSDVEVLLIEVPMEF